MIKSIYIATVDGAKKVSAHVTGVWAAHTGLGDDGQALAGDERYVVTHVPSGKKMPTRLVGGLLAIDEAIELAAYLNEQWPTEDEPSPRDHRLIEALVAEAWNRG